MGLRSEVERIEIAHAETVVKAMFESPACVDMCWCKGVTPDDPLYKLAHDHPSDPTDTRYITPFDLVIHTICNGSVLIKVKHDTTGSKVVGYELTRMESL